MSSWKRFALFLFVFFYVLILFIKIFFIKHLHSVCVVILRRFLCSWRFELAFGSVYFSVCRQNKKPLRNSLVLYSNIEYTTISITKSFNYGPSSIFSCVKCPEIHSTQAKTSRSRQTSVLVNTNICHERRLNPRSQAQQPVL